MVVGSEAHEEEPFNLEDRMNTGLLACVIGCLCFWGAFGYLLYLVS